MITKQQSNDAILISVDDYMELINPHFEGQTRVGENGEYKMYWSSGGVLYVTTNQLMPYYPQQ